MSLSELGHAYYDLLVACCLLGCQQATRLSDDKQRVVGKINE